MKKKDKMDKRTKDRKNYRKVKEEWKIKGQKKYLKDIQMFAMLSYSPSVLIITKS